VRTLWCVAVASTALVLAGCSGSLSTGTTGTDSTPGVAVHGTVYGGRQAIVGASVYLYAANTTGYGSLSVPLLASPVTTDASGNFTITGNYTCPAAASQVYLYAVGGDPGAGVNSASGLLAALGTCPASGTLSSGLTVNVDEVSTIATAFAIAGYATDPTHVSSSGTTLAKTGIANAFATVANLETLSTGVALATTPAGNGKVPQSKINTLADILAACVNSSGPSSTECGTLLSNAKSGSTTPSNTAAAAINIAHNPGANVATLYGLVSGAAAPWQPILSAAPKDFTLAVTYTGGGMASPTAVSVAASGDVWVANYFYVLSEFSPTGATTAFPSGITGNGFNQSYGMALDVSGNVWVANEQTNPNSGSGNVAKLNSSGAAVATGITVGGINYPVAAAADSNGNMWFADYGTAKVSVLDSTGAAVSPASGWGGTSLSFPVALAIDSSHNAWVANQASSTSITKVSSNGSVVTNYDCDCNGPSGIAIDASSNVWVANYYGSSVSEVSSSGTLLVDAATGGGVDHPQGIAVDGNGTVWVANYLTNTLSEIAGAGSGSAGTYLSPSSGLGTDAALSHPYALAIDGSGNIWVSNFANSTLTQFVGAAAPVKTPLAGSPQLP
jgi:streptogramin lyase